jgi:hypothetical protein
VDETKYRRESGEVSRRAATRCWCAEPIAPERVALESVALGLSRDQKATACLIYELWDKWSAEIEIIVV